MKLGRPALVLVILISAIYASARLVGAESPSTNISELNSADLFVRPGILDIGFKVGNMWQCLGQFPTGPAKIVNTTSNGSGDIIVRVQSANERWMDLHFYLSNGAALLRGIDNSDGSSVQEPGELKMVIFMFAGGCKK
jgi:hypothetical protein